MARRAAIFSVGCRAVPLLVWMAACASPTAAPPSSVGSAADAVADAAAGELSGAPEVAEADSAAGDDAGAADAGQSQAGDTAAETAANPDSASSGETASADSFDSAEPDAISADTAAEDAILADTAAADAPDSAAPPDGDAAGAQEVAAPADAEPPDVATADAATPDTSGVCQNASDCAGLEDGNLCNGTLYCEAGQCVVNPASVVVCSASFDTACAKTACAPATGKCALLPVKELTPCNDGDKCTDGDACEKGQCVGTNVCQCKSHEDCGKYEDGNACNGTLYCNKAKGTCHVNPATVVACPTAADTACSLNACQPKTGQCQMTALPDATACDDGNPCTANEACAAGQCQATANVCDCQKDADCAAKEDGNWCNGTLYCDQKAFPKVCKVNPATVVQCPTGDDSACAERKCQPKTGQCPLVPLPDNATCEADGNPCTAGDACQKGQCVQSANTCPCQQDSDCAALEDGDLCNGTLYCNKVNNQCLVNPATVVLCPYGADTDCSKATCNPATGQCFAKAAPDGSGCEADGNPCTAADVCAGGQCVKSANVCDCQLDADCLAKNDADLCNGTLMCDQPSKKCVVNPASVVACPGNLGAPCTLNQCNPKTGQCSSGPANELKWCDGDNNPCTFGDTCVGGKCVLGSNVCACQTDQHCDGKDNGSLCDGVLYCDKTAVPFACAVSKPTIVQCSAANDTACAKNQCQPQTAKCAFGAVSDGTGCDDGSLCTVADACKGAVCTGAAKNCDDGKPCTADSCVGAGTCSHKPLICDDGSPCTTDTCDAAKGCQFAALADGANCSDGLCWQAATCKAGKCNGKALDCDDGKPCTTDACDPAKGCVHTLAADGSPCSDGNLCTVADACTANACTGKPANCDDANPCTDDACVPADGSCSGSYNAKACDDGNACTSADLCKNGACAGKIVACADIGCMTAACDQLKGCVANKPLPAGTVCNDGSLCTTGDACGLAGQCTGTAVNCDDKIACTADSCDAQLGCQHQAVDALCEDGEPCTGNACDAAKGCVFNQLADATPCATDRFCQAGLCVWAKRLQLGAEFGCALRADNTVWCWGLCGTGQCGDGSLGSVGGVQVHNKQPKQIQTLTGVTEIAAADYAACALVGGAGSGTKPGSVWCWGANGGKALGTGDSINTLAVPKVVQGLDGATALFAGNGTFCALKAGGDLWCWGSNNYGQAGNGANAPNPVTAPGKAVWSQVNAWDSNDYGACAASNGVVSCVGTASAGTLGIGSGAVTSFTPAGNVSLPAPAVALAGGNGHLCALLAGGAAWCWGQGAAGQLGGKYTGNQLSPVPMANWPKLRHIDASGQTTCGVAVDGSGWCTGDNDFGQLGSGGSGDAFGPSQVVGLANAVSVAVADEFACALDAFGQVWCWGRGQYGGLGDGQDGSEHASGVAQLLPMSALPQAENCKGKVCDDANPCTADSCAAAGQCVFAAANEGKACGSAGFCHAGACAWASGIALGSQHSCALRPDGSALCWGNNANGQLGTGAFGADAANPQPVGNVANCLALRADGDDTCALDSAGVVRCWGAGSQCQLGGKAADLAQPATLITSAADVAIGLGHICAVGKSGAVQCVGSNANGQLGTGKAAPAPACAPQAALKTAALVPGSLGCGDGFCLGIDGTGALWHWGRNDHGQAGAGAAGGDNLAPSAVAGNWSQVSAGVAFACGIGTDGLVRCWGANDSGQCGGAAGADVAKPALVGGLGPVSAIATGAAHACALGADQQLRCWGKSNLGQLGQGSAAAVAGPNMVATLSHIQAIAAGGDHSCALDAAGQVWCWGANDHGQLGTGKSGAGAWSAAPAMVAASAAGAPADQCKGGAACFDGDPCTADVCDPKTAQCSHPPAADGIACGKEKLCSQGKCKTPWAVDLVAGRSHTCALRAGGQMQCFGYNAYGQLGVNNSTNTPLPTTPNGMATGTAFVAAGENSVCAVKDSGKVFCWGNNSYGLAGTASNLPNKLTVPTEIPNISNAVGVAVNFAACAWQAGGGVYCWGRSLNGEAGSVVTVSPYLAASGAKVAGSDELGWAEPTEGHVCARTAAGSVYCWGSDTQTGTGKATGAKLTTASLVAGSSAVSGLSVCSGWTLAADAAGALRVFGMSVANVSLQSGYFALPVNAWPPSPVPFVAGVTQVDTGPENACVVGTGGKVWCWGADVILAIGGVVTLPLRPAPVQGLPPIRKVAVGVNYACGLAYDGAMWCWGTNSFGQFGNGTTSTVPALAAPIAGTAPQ